MQYTTHSDILHRAPHGTPEPPTRRRHRRRELRGAGGHRDGLYLLVGCERDDQRDQQRGQRERRGRRERTHKFRGGRARDGRDGRRVRAHVVSGVPAQTEASSVAVGFRRRSERGVSASVGVRVCAAIALTFILGAVLDFRYLKGARDVRYLLSYVNNDPLLLAALFVRATSIPCFPSIWFHALPNTRL